MTPEAFIAWRDALGGRRFFLTLGGNAINTVLFYMGLLSESGYLTTFAGTVVAYITAATIQHGGKE